MPITETVADNNRSFWRVVGRVNAVVIFVSLVLGVYLVSALLLEPLSSIRILSYLLLMFVTGVLSNRLISCLRRGSRHPVSGFAAVRAALLQIGLTILVPVLLIVAVNALVNIREMAIIEQHFAATIAYIEQARQQLGHPPHTLAPGQTQGSPVSFLYAYNKDAYLIETSGGSLDMDGTTLYYLSTVSHWQRIHNDLLHTPHPSAAVNNFLSLEKHMTTVRYQF